MFKKRTVFVVGAGASCEIKLPSGDALKSAISKKVDYKFGDFDTYPRTGDRHLYDHINRAAMAQNEPVSEWMDDALRLQRALPFSISIDNLLYLHQGDLRLETIGKLAIASSILEAERSSPLYINRSKRRRDLAGLQGTWYVRFFQLLTEGIPKSEVGGLFNNVSFVVFNYDRCIEQFLVSALMEVYHISLSEAAAIVGRAEFFHPYGTVGRLPWQPGRSQAVDIGAEDVDLLAVAANLKTFTEEYSDKISLRALHKAVNSAETIVFLGFAFHPQNMTLLGLRERAKSRTRGTLIYGTTLAISDSDCEVIRKSLNEGNLDVVSAVNFRSCTCCELFEHFQRSIPSV